MIKPILFSGPMVRAILAGEKTVTRRPIVLPTDPEGCVLHFVKHFRFVGESAKAVFGIRNTNQEIIKSCPFGRIKGFLWVRETWAEGVPGCEEQGGYAYRADHEYPDRDGPARIKWRPAIHMPRDASRITLEVTDIRVERVQAISEDGEGGAEDEGVCNGDIPIFSSSGGVVGVKDEPATYAFREAWDEMYAHRGLGWSVNPWVWVVLFKRRVRE